MSRNKPTMNIMQTAKCLVDNEDVRVFTIIATTQEVKPAWTKPRGIRSPQEEKVVKNTTPIDPTKGIISIESPLGSLLYRTKSGRTVHLNGHSYQITEKGRSILNSPQSSRGVSSSNTKVSPEPPAKLEATYGGYYIKGNINASGEKIYHMPGQMYYDILRVSLRHGGKNFRTEDEAIRAGFRKSKV